MLEIRKDGERGNLDQAWLRTKSTFTHGGKEESKWTCFGDLCAIDEYWLSPNKERSVHGDRDAEIITFVLKGRIEHLDNLGNTLVLQDGDMSCMSAGAGITHFRRNLSDREPAHDLQIGFFSETHGVSASIEKKRYPAAEKLNRLRIVASPDGRENSMRIWHDNLIYAAILEARREIVYVLSGQRKSYVHIARGTVTLNGQRLNEGDGAKILDEMEITLTTVSGAEFLLLDLARCHPL